MSNSLKRHNLSKGVVDVMIVAEIILLILALSVDSLAAAVSYGIAKIKITVWQAVIISLVCSVFLILSVGFAAALSFCIPKWTTKTGSFLILFIIGAVKLFEKQKSETPEKLSTAKTVLFAVSMSLDGLAAGFGAGLVAEDNVAVVGFLSCLITFLTVYCGNFLGLSINKNAPPFIQKLGGAAIILVAVCKLI